MSAPAGLRFERVSKVFGAMPVLEDVDLHVEAGEFVCLVGASGCGKSTLLAIAAGLQSATTGRVLLDGEAVSAPGAHCGLVFQSFSLYPWRTVAGNVAFGLELARYPRAEIDRRVAAYLAVMGLTDFADTLPGQLSGGMKQRTAIARALATRPEVVLLDEPFGSLDALTRAAMRELVLGVWRELRTTILMVTHDVEEAVFLSSRIYVMSPRPGRVAAEIAVPLPAERPRTIVREAAFQAICRDVEDALHAQAVPA